MDPPPTQYLDRGGAALAYQVVGDGPVDVVCFFEIGQHLDLAWTDPDIHRYLERAASYSRTADFQRRGLGLSDQIPYMPTVEQQADDVIAVMDALGMRVPRSWGRTTANRPGILSVRRRTHSSGGRSVATGTVKASA